MNIKTIAAVGALSLFSTGAYAATATDTLTVSATVTDSCQVTTTDVTFGDYDPVAGTAVSSTGGAINVTCSNGTGYEIGLGAGAGTGATVTARQMKDAATGTLSYALYKDAGKLNNWGETTGGAGDTLGGLTGTGTLQSHPVYGEVSANQNTVPKGSYTDSVVVTVTYGV